MRAVNARRPLCHVQDGGRRRRVGANAFAGGLLFRPDDATAGDSTRLLASGHDLGSLLLAERAERGK
jgi:hypothetical protein